MSKYRVVGYEEAAALGISSDILSSDYCWVIVDDQNQFIGCDGGQPEDQCLVRDWKWVCEALNNEHTSQSARITELEADSAHWKKEANRWVEQTNKVTAELDAAWVRIREQEAERDAVREALLWWFHEHDDRIEAAWEEGATGEGVEAALLAAAREGGVK